MARSLSTRGRFAVAYLVLGAAVGAALGALIVLVERPGPQPPPPWSAWQPQASSESSRLLEIADHVGQEYRLPSGNQLTAVKIGGPATGKNLKAILIPNKPKPSTLADFERFDESKSAIFVLCGLGQNCKIGEGAPSTSRGAVIRREALELALYTLRYNKPIDNVLVFVPPGPGEKRFTSTLFFHRSELSSRLSHPLRTTLPHKAPQPDAFATTEKKTVDELTGSVLYKYVGILTANGYGNVLVIQHA
ncbi:MAG TPA: hypothetical protein VLD16_06425 [Gaiellaceae bacterium]|nr:hypothetical protein [Gaiellaceae bacterium]